MSLGIAVVIGFTLFGLAELASKHRLRSHELAIRDKELEIKRLDAERKVLERRERLLLPAFVDASDPEAVANYKRVKQELDKTL